MWEVVTSGHTCAQKFVNSCNASKHVHNRPCTFSTPEVRISCAYACSKCLWSSFCVRKYVWNYASDALEGCTYMWFGDCCTDDLVIFKRTCGFGIISLIWGLVIILLTYDSVINWLFNVHYVSVIILLTSDLVIILLTSDLVII